jgi:hypothetical protein
LSKASLYEQDCLQNRRFGVMGPGTEVATRATRSGEQARTRSARPVTGSGAARGGP